MTERPEIKLRWPLWIRLSLRGLMIAVLLLAAVLGWVASSARIQREAVAAIENARGYARYDCQGPGSFKSTLAHWMWRLFGLGRDYWDYVSNVVWVEVGPDDPDHLMDNVARLSRLKILSFSDDDANSDRSLYFGDDQDRPVRPNFTGAVLDKLEGLTELQQLSFVRAPPISDTNLAHLRPLTALRVLSLPSSRDSQITDAGLENLEDMTGITVLNLERHTHLTSAGLVHLRRMNRLARLWMSETRVDDLSPIAHLTGLSVLELGGTRITDAGLAPVAGMTSLNILGLERTPISDAGLAPVGALMRLQRLDLYSTRVTDAGLKHIAGLASLRSLDLAATGISDAGMAHVAGLPSLTTLSVHGTRVSDVALLHIARLRALRHLDLGKTRVTDAGLKHLTSLALLETLNVGETPVGASGLRKLAAIKSLKVLVIDRSQAALDAPAAIHKIRPKLEIRALEDGDSGWFRRYR